MAMHSMADHRSLIEIEHAGAEAGGYGASLDLQLSATATDVVSVHV